MTRIQPLDPETLAVRRRRLQERRWLLWASCIVLLGTALVWQARTAAFDGVRAQVAAGEVVDLSRVESSRALEDAFGAVYADPADRRLAAAHLYGYLLRHAPAHPLDEALPNVGRLNTTALAIPAAQAAEGGEAFRRRLVRSYARLGLDAAGRVLPDTLAPGLDPAAPYRLTGRVRDADGAPATGWTVTLRGTRTARTHTDADGRFAFVGLTAEDTVTVQPAAAGWATTPRRWTAGGPKELTFRARPHRLNLVGGREALNRLKPGLIVRSPGVFNGTLLALLAVYLLAFYGLHAYWSRKGFAGDAFLLPLLHLLTGLGLILMVSLQDPLRDQLLVRGYVGGLAAGLVLLALTARLDFQHRFWRRGAYGWLALALAVAAVLYALGTGPTGSDARVNLRVPGLGSVQPVELVKLCLVLFLAGFFARNWTFLRHLRQRAGLPRGLRRLDVPRLRDVAPVAAGLGLALGTLFLLKDMGPALVLGCTFLGLYGIARRRWVAVGAGFAALVGGCWVAYQTKAVAVVAHRLEMLASPWENFVVGGEHLAHAFWALAAGGVAGQGLGDGSPGFIPAAHTDMVLAALGEEAGLLGLAAVLACYVLLVHRAARIALRAGGTFSLLLGLAVALLLLAQVVLIAGGALGLLPLSGVVTPFLSFGKSAMVVHGVLVGMLLSLSARPAPPQQAAVQRQHFGPALRGVTVAAALLVGAVVGKAWWIQTVAADDLTLRPALVLRADGQRAYTYNPRLYAARTRLVRGTIYDRHGLPLATSRWDEVAAFAPRYDSLGVPRAALDRTADRHYPLGALTFYLLGDVRSRVKWGADNSLYAEHRYLSHLRGYDNHPTPVEKRGPRAGTTQSIVRYDYAELLPLVRRRDGNSAARALLRRPRDLHLTLDARLQAKVAALLAERVPEGKTASVVVLDAATGEVLASVTHPLPEAAFADPSAAHRDPLLFDRGYGQGAKAPGSTFKLVTAIAALQRDPRADDWTHEVAARDRYARRGEPTGTVDMARALSGSSNVYFAALAREVVGADTLLRAAEAFGFDVGPRRATRAERLDLLRAPDNLRQAGFGQGPVTGSPLQVALVAATLAADGARPTPRWVRGDEATPGRAERVLMPHHARRLAAYMRRVVTDRDGTGRVLRDLSVPVAGKSGTAEERQRTDDGRLVTVNHAWFTGFAPYTPSPTGRSPRIAFAVLVEEGGLGGVVAAPLAGAVVEAAADLGLIERPPAP